MVGIAVAVMSGLVLVYALLSRRLTAANITAPMLSIIAGVIVYWLLDFRAATGVVHLIAELTLITVLFHDASTVKLSQLRNDPGIAERLLLIGFPLALLATFLVARGLFPGIGVAGALLLAAAITPTDAGLGAPTVLNPVVPLRARRALNVESGLNDGLATPLVLLALAALAAEEGHTQPTIMQVGVVPVVLAVVSAVSVGLAAAWAMDRTRRAGMSGHRGRTVATLALPLFLFGLADIIGANGFITAFVAGLVFGAASVTLREEPQTSELLEVSSDLLSFVVWFFAGGLLLVVFQAELQWSWLLLAILALTVLRIVPVMVSLIGTGFSWPTVTFMGWFGPRGLATIVFALLAVEELGSDSPVIPAVAGVVSCTIVLSVFAHGMSATPLSTWYGRRVADSADPITQDVSVDAVPSRGRAGL